VSTGKAMYRKEKEIDKNKKKEVRGDHCSSV
jgi:hypothetical protein